MIRAGLARTVVIALSALLLAACAGNQSKPVDPKCDPWEPFNRKVHAFNMGFDRVIGRPIAKGYDFIMPEAPQRGVRNFFHNLAYPVTFLNLILQGQFKDSLTATGRFLMNTTIGLLGFFDVATKAGIEKFEEDFGQTLAVWGWEDSRFVVMPFFGPYTARDLIGRSFYGYFHPISYMAREYDSYSLMVIDLVTLRAELLPFDEQLQGAPDPYALIRDIYLQRRQTLIYNGEPPLPDYESMLNDECDG